MSMPKKVSALARLNEITATPHPKPLGAAALPDVEGIVRYTAEVPKGLHRSLKLFAMDQETSTYAVTKALFALLADDEDVRRKVIQVLPRE
jgi:hypothetical protein